MPLKRSIFLILIALVSIVPYTQAETRADLTIIQDSNKKILTENDFRQIQVDAVFVQDPVYNKHKHYTGYWLLDILNLAGVHLDPNSILTFKALDGYTASIAYGDIQKTGVKAFVAIADLDKEDGWEKFQDGKQLITPGPYYLVWQTPLEDVMPSVKLPWPYQMIEISIGKANETQEKLFPDSDDKTESVTKGYKVFTQNCVACHSLNLEGGVVGPELNVPKNVLEYEDRNFLKNFISDPSSYRARSRMPSFNRTLSDQEIEDVLDYLTWIGKHKSN